MDNTKDKKDTRKPKYKYDWVGDLAAIFGIIALLPLVFYVTTTQQVRDLHLGWLLLKLMSVSLWLVYGLANSIIPSVISAVSVGLLLLYLIGVKIYINHTIKN